MAKQLSMFEPEPNQKSEKVVETYSATQDLTLPSQEIVKCPRCGLEAIKSKRENDRFYCPACTDGNQPFYFATGEVVPF